MKLTSGTAIRLASGESSGTDWNWASRSGTSAKLSASCTRNAPRQPASGTTRPPSTARITATAPKDNQNPADSTAQGSTASTTSSAIASTREGAMRRPANSTSAPTSSINHARSTGTPIPASSA